MNLINRLERKFGKYAIHNLMNYIIIIYAAGYFINMISPEFYYEFLRLDVNMLLKGQIWRIFTFLFQKSDSNLIFLALELYLYYMIGNSLERAWGAFRFNLYYLSGILFNIIAIVIMYLVTENSYELGLTYINRSLFFAFAALYPNVQFLIFFVIPVKIKYLAYIYGGLILYELYTYITMKYYYIAIAIAVALGNFLIFFLSTRNYKKYSPNEYKRKANFKRQVRSAQGSNVVDFQGRKTVTRHKCAICNRTELDDDNLEFRFCSKCDGNYEYCMDHLFTHEHVKKPN